METAHPKNRVSGSTNLPLLCNERQLAPGFTRKFVERLGKWRRRARGRRQLAQLDCRGLHDIGISRRQAREEWKKPFWQR